MQTKIVEVFGDLARAESCKFSFKSRKATDAAGNQIVIPAAPAIEMVLPVPTLAGLIEILNQGGAGASLLQEVAADAVFDFVKSNLIGTDGFNTTDYDPAKLSWEAIASAPREDGRRGISKERWAEFKEDYCAVMAQVSGASAVQIENAAKFFVAKLAPVKSHKQRLQRLGDLLGVYLQNSANADVQICEFLAARIAEYLAMEDAPVEDVLG